MEGFSVGDFQCCYPLHRSAFRKGRRVSSTNRQLDGSTLYGRWMGLMKVASSLALLILLGVTSSCASGGSHSSSVGKTPEDTITYPAKPTSGFQTGGSIGVFARGGL